MACSLSLTVPESPPFAPRAAGALGPEEDPETELCSSGSEDDAQPTARSFPRVVKRPEGEEEITPPYIERSHESFSIAHLLQSKMGHEEGYENSGQDSPRGSPKSMRASPAMGRCIPGSPTVAAAAKGLLDVQQHSFAESAVSCLMSMASSKQSAAEDSDDSDSPHARRGLKMLRRSSVLARPARPSPLQPRPGPDRLFPRELHPRSSCKVEQLQCLAVAYQLCPNPTAEQINYLAQRINLPARAVSHWFQRRQELQGWVQQYPQISKTDLQSLFYAPPQQAPPTPPPADPFPMARFPSVLVGV